MQWETLFDGYPSLLTYREGDDLVPRSDGKLVPPYKTIHRAPTAEDFERHFRGEVSLGRSPLRPDGKVTFGAIDLDIYQTRDDALEEIKKAFVGSSGALFRSKSRGLHFFMFSEAVEASDMVDALDFVRSKLPKQYRAKAKELFPRQTRPGETDTPTAINLPMFGAKRELLCLFAPKAQGLAPDLIDPDSVGRAIQEHVLLPADQVRALAERNRERKKGGRPVREIGEVGFKEPVDAPGRQEFLFKVGSSMRSRGADMEQVKEQLFEIDRHYAEIGHPLWEGKGRIEPARIESALKSIAKFEQGTPSGLHYSKVGEFNEEFAVLDLDGQIEILDCHARELKTWNWSHFTKKVANRRVRIGKDNVQIASLWLVDVDRREYAGLVIEPAAYDGLCYNLWPGFAVAPREGDPSLFLRYIDDVLCSGDEELARWIIHYLADAVQRPTEPSPPTAVAIRGPQGQGKTFLFKFLKRIFGRAAREVASSDRLFARFNRSIVGCTIIGAEEAIFSGDPRLAQVLKTFISSDLWTYEEKYRATLEMKNVHRLIATTNSEHAVLIEDDDRRWTIVEMPKRWDILMEEGRRAATAFWEPFYDFLRGDGPAIVLNHLLGVEVDQALIRFAFVNSAKADDKIMSDPVLQFLDEVAETLTLPHDRDGKGVASIQSIVEDIRGRSPHARHMSPEVVTVRILEIVPHADRVRTTRYVVRAQMDQNGFTHYLEKTRQRGIGFGSPDDFRAAVARITHRAYGQRGTWAVWVMECGLNEHVATDEEMEEAFRRVNGKGSVSPGDTLVTA